jgi:hypothetical protein
LFKYIFASLRVITIPGLEEVGEKEDPEYGEHYEKLDDNYDPDLPAPG